MVEVIEGVSAIVLAGGRSQRMGCDKRGVAVNGRPLLEHALDVATEVSADVVLATRQGEDNFPIRRGVRVISDRDAFQGPVSALCDVLKHVQCPSALVLAVDMPGVTVACLSLLCGRGRQAEADVVVFARDGRDEPFPGLYHRRLAELDEPAQSMRGLVNDSRIRAIRVDASELSAVGKPGVLLHNVNRPSDLSPTGL